MSEILCVDCSPFDPNLLVTGSADRSVAVWDTRNVKCKLFSLRNHKEEVFICNWYNLLKIGELNQIQPHAW